MAKIGWQMYMRCALDVIRVPSRLVRVLCVGLVGSLEGARGGHGGAQGREGKPQTPILLSMARSRVFNAA